MQHERDKKRSSKRTEQIEGPFEVELDDPILSAFEILEFEVEQLKRNYKGVATSGSDWTITMPRGVWESIITAAKAGLHKGRGRKGRPRDKIWSKFRKQVIVDEARARKDELITTGMTASAAEKKVSEEAAKRGKDRDNVNMSPSTIRDRMKRSPSDV
jgi:hypothetical protein